VQGLPTDIVRAREPVLEKVLSHLPDEVLSALAHGLERHAGQLEAGRLYADYDGGGCAVGVMLRELSPSSYQQGRIQFWLRRRRHASVLTERVDFDRGVVTRLSHVETCFDLTAAALVESAPETGTRVAANATGRWMAEGCRQQLRARNSGFYFPKEWVTPRPRRLLPPLPLSTARRRMVAHDGTERLVLVPSRPRLAVQRRLIMPGSPAAREPITVPGIALAACAGTAASSPPEVMASHASQFLASATSGANLVNCAA
jgi:hypothetical protein